MKTDLYSLIWKPLLFKLDAEQAHFVSAGALKLAAFFPPGRWALKQLYSVDPEKDHAKMVAGIRFPNPIGLAAGFDKNGELVDSMACLGFGFVEIGTVTPKPQAGNPRPRLFRLPEDEAIINRMGFNNDGMMKVADRLARRKNREMIVGGNLGKNKDTPNEHAGKDYVLCFNALAPHVDYITFNLSSPNTPGLRQLLEKEFLNSILEPVQAENQKLTTSKPVFLKISPDMETDQLHELVETCIQLGISGIVANNTTIGREDLKTDFQTIQAMGPGGLSGKPLVNQSLEVLKTLKSITQNRLPIVATGGIMTPEDAKTRLEMGADLVQVYSGLVYYGPGLVRDSIKALHNQDGFLI